ncbi:MAG: O-antigen ligase [Pseudomonadota bacterium]
MTVQAHQPQISQRENRPASKADWYPGWLPSGFIMAIVFISFRPFATGTKPVAGQAPQGGDIINQLGFGGLGVVCILLLAAARPRQIMALNHPLLWLMVPILALGVLSADNPSGAARAMAFSVIVVLCAATALALPKTLKDMTAALAFGVGATVFISYVGLVLYPEQAMHGGGGFEPQHAGLWRGVYQHKNIASYIFGAFAIIGVFLARNGKTAFGLLVAVLSVIFMVQAGSKTVLAVFPVALLTAALASWVPITPLRIVIALTPVAALSLATLGAVVFPSLLEALRDVIPRLSYTGRTDLWEFGLYYLNQTPWTGYGFESFWNTGRVINLEQPIELNWDVRGIVHGHNSWLDAAIGFGVPGAVCFFLVLVVMPLWDFARLPRTGNAAKLGTLFIGLWILTSLGASLESFFMRRADPVWFAMLLSVFGLRITVHMTANRK